MPVVAHAGGGSDLHRVRTGEAGKPGTIFPGQGGGGGASAFADGEDSRPDRGRRPGEQSLLQRDAGSPGAAGAPKSPASVRLTRYPGRSPRGTG